MEFHVEEGHETEAGLVVDFQAESLAEDSQAESLAEDSQEEGLAAESQEEESLAMNTQGTATAAIELNIPYGSEDDLENPFLTDSDSEASPHPTTLSTQLPTNVPLALSSQSDTISVHAPFVSSSQLCVPRLEGISLAELIYMTAEALPKFTDGDSISPACAAAFYKRANGEWIEAAEWDDELDEDVLDVCIMHRLQSIIDRGSEAIEADEAFTNKPVMLNVSSVVDEPVLMTAAPRDGFLKKAFKRLIFKQPQSASVPVTASSSTLAVFGRPLEALTLPPEQQYPLFIAETLAILDKAEPCEGMFRLNGLHSTIGRLRALIDEGASLADEDELLNADVHSLCGLLKLYLRLLPESLLAVNGLYSAWAAVGSLIEAGSTSLAHAASRFLIETAMPLRHRSLLKTLLGFLQRHVLPAEAITRMSASNLAACIGPNLIRQCSGTDAGTNGNGGSDSDSSVTLGQELMGSTLGGTLLRFLLSEPENADKVVVVGLGKMLYDLRNGAGSTSSMSSSPGSQSSSDVPQAGVDKDLLEDTAVLSLADKSPLEPSESCLQEGTLVFLTNIADVDNEEGVLDGWWHGFSCAGTQSCSLSRVPHNYLAIVCQCDHPNQLL